MDEAVRAQLHYDLLWILRAPALLPAAELSWCPEQAFSQDLVDRIPEIRWQALEQARHGKLGHYFEALVQALFHASPEFRILTSNCIIRGATRTLGELDLLLEDCRNGRILHLELALKFYLLLPPVSGVADDCRWIGSGLKDFLTLKAGRLMTHQLRLPELVTREDAWPAHLPKPDVSLGWVTGRAFVPFGSSGTDVPLLARKALTRPWITVSQASKVGLTGHWINKSQWLSRHAGPAELPRHRPPAQWLGRLTHEEEAGHWFIVPDDWPLRARESMLRRFAPAGETGLQP
jgi:hypothetical protein